MGAAGAEMSMWQHMWANAGAWGPGKGKGPQDWQDSSQPSAQPNNDDDPLRIPKRLVGHIIGKQGANIKNLRESSGARIDIDLEDSDDFAKLVITGKPDQVETARRLIRESLEAAEKQKLENKRKNQSGDSQRKNEDKFLDDKNKETVRVPRCAVGRVIGKGGKVLSGIRDRSGAYLKIPQIDESDGEVPFYDFVVAGSMEAIEKAKTEIKDIVDKIERDKSENDGNEESSQKVLTFPQGIAGAIIGLKGHKIAELRQQFGTRISVDCHPDHCDVTVSGGNAEKIQAAIVAIEAIAKEKQELDASEAKGVKGEPSDAKQKAIAQGAVFETFEIPAKAMGLVIGPKGANVAELRARSGARITLEKNDESDRIPTNFCKVHVSGSAEQVRRARTLVQEAADGNTGTREDNTKVLKVSKSVVGKIIGKGGQTVQRIGRESGAQVKVSTDEDPCVIRIGGSKKCVQDARRLIDEVLGVKGAHGIIDEPKESQEPEQWNDSSAVDYSGFYGSRPYSGAGGQPYSGAPHVGMLHGAKPYSGGAAFYASALLPPALDGIDIDDI